MKAKLKARPEFDKINADANVIKLNKLMRAERYQTKDKRKKTAVGLYPPHKAWMDLNQRMTSNDEYFHNINTCIMM